VTALFLTSSFICGNAQGASKLPQSGPAFKGKVGVTREASKPDWPERPKAHAGAPNVVLILLDDVGYGEE
jgi:hypothetical protein